MHQISWAALWQQSSAGRVSTYTALTHPSETKLCAIIQTGNGQITRLNKKAENVVTGYVTLKSSKSQGL